MLLSRARVLVVVSAVALGCGGEASPPAPADAPGQPLTAEGGADGGKADGADGGAVDAGPRCGLSFDEALEAFEGERVCQETVYDLVTGYCTHWVACSSL